MGRPIWPNRLRIGQVHKRVGLTPRGYMGAYAIYLEIVLPRVMTAFEFDRRKQQRAVTALTKIIALDQEIALTAYFAAEVDLPPFALPTPG